MNKKYTDFLSEHPDQMDDSQFKLGKNGKVQLKPLWSDKTPNPEGKWRANAFHIKNPPELDKENEIRRFARLLKHGRPAKN